MPDTFYHALPVGSHIEHYEIRSVLGAGGFGVTYLGWDSRLHQQVAIKEYLPADIAMRQADGSNVIAKSSQDRDNYQYGLDRFLNEARTLAKFREPNLIRVQAFLEANGTAYMVMDYEEGETLSAYLDRIGTLDETTLKGIIIPILDGLRAVHAADFLHRDIKPGNIYLRRNGPPVLIDFGAARQALGEHSRSMTGIVTAGYAPFEQYSTRGKQGPWTDLYAIGATMYRCISGHAPVESAERMAAFSEGEADPLVPASELKQGQFSTELLSAIDWMLKPAAKDRPQRVEEVLALLLGRAGVPPISREVSVNTFSTQPPSAIETSSSTAPSVSRSPPSRITLMIAGTIAVVLLVIVGLQFGVIRLPNSEATQQAKLSALELDGKIQALSQRLTQGQTANAQRLGASSALMAMLKQGVYESAALTQLVGQHKAAQSLLAEKEYQQAIIILPKVEKGYEQMLHMVEVAEPLHQTNDEVTRIHDQWQSYARQKSHEQEPKHQTLEQQYQDAQNKLSQGAWSEAEQQLAGMAEQYKDLLDYWKQQDDPEYQKQVKAKAAYEAYKREAVTKQQQAEEARVQEQQKAKAAYEAYKKATAR